MQSANKGEWSELYAFARLLKDGKIYAADENVNKLDDIFFPILKLVRADVDMQDVDYHTGDKIRIYKNSELIGEVDSDYLEKNTKILFDSIFKGDNKEKGAFEIAGLDSFLENMKIKQIKAPSTEKVDIRMQIHDIKTGYTPVAGFSVKSDVGSPPTLLNAGHNTKFRYQIDGITDEDMNEINAIDKTVCSEYMKSRFEVLFRKAKTVKFNCVLDKTYESNLMLIDSMLPEIYGDFVLYHYMTMNEKHIDCEMLCKLLEIKNPLGYSRSNFYTYKIKKLLCASALGMTPGKEWDGNEAATGGYVIVRRDGEVLCYHIYNRNYFESYLLKNTVIDRPSASRYDYAYVFKKDGHYYIDLNVQIRFKSISAAKRDYNFEDEKIKRIAEYMINGNI